VVGLQPGLPGEIFGGPWWYPRWWVYGTPRSGILGEWSFFSCVRIDFQFEFEILPGEVGGGSVCEHSGRGTGTQFAWSEAGSDNPMGVPISAGEPTGLTLTQFDYFAGGTNSGACGIGLPQGACEIAVVPEPSTYILLATGC